MKIDGVILDFDGTLVDSEIIWKDIEQKILTNLGHPIPHDLLYSLSGMGIKKWVEIIFEELLIENLDPEIVADLIMSEVNEEIVSNAKAHDGLYEMVDLVKAHNLPFAICSATPLDLIEETLERLNLRKEFDLIHSLYGLATQKPSPIPYIDTSKKLGVDIKNCVVVEDSIPGINSALKSGAKTFAMPGHFDLERVRQIDVDIVSDFFEVKKFIEENLV